MKNLLILFLFYSITSSAQNLDRDNSNYLLKNTAGLLTLGNDILDPNAQRFSTLQFRENQLDSIRPNALSELNSLQTLPLNITSLLACNTGKLNLSEYNFTSASFSSFTDISVANYKTPKEISSFQFSDHVLTTDNGINFAIRTTLVSSSVSSAYSSALGNGASVTERGIYEYAFKGSDNTSYTVLKAPTEDQPVSLTLYTSANVACNNRLGSFAINTGDGNTFSFSTIGSDKAVIGWNDPNAGTRITLSATSIETNADIIQHGIFQSTSGIAVSTENFNDLKFDPNTQAYFSSANPGNTGITIENLNVALGSGSGITLKQGSISNWIGTISGASNSELYLPGTLTLQSHGTGGILLSTITNQDSDQSSIRFAIGSKEVFRVSGSSIMIGTVLENPSLILRIESHRQGVLLPTLTTDEMLDMGNPPVGTIIYNVTLKTFCTYDGDGWNQVLTRKIKRQSRIL